jgi:hypothetical protein
VILPPPALATVQAGAQDWSAPVWSWAPGSSAGECGETARAVARTVCPGLTPDLIVVASQVGLERATQGLATEPDCAARGWDVHPPLGPDCPVVVGVAADLARPASRPAHLRREGTQSLPYCLGRRHLARVALGFHTSNIRSVAYPVKGNSVNVVNDLRRFN